MGSVQNLQRKLSGIALILMLIAFIVAIILFSTPWWYHVEFDLGGSVTKSDAGLFKYTSCIGDFCSSVKIKDTGDSDYKSATIFAKIVFSITFCLTAVYFLFAALQVSGRQFGKLDNTKICVTTSVLAALITIGYILILVFFPIIYGGDQESSGGDYISFQATYYVSYYGLIIVVLMTIIATALLIFETGSQIRTGGYKPV